MSEHTFGLSTIGQILVPVHDAERATAFYRDVLGMRFLFAFPHMAFFDADGVRLYLSEPESPSSAARPRSTSGSPTSTLRSTCSSGVGQPSPSDRTSSDATGQPSCGWPSRRTRTPTTSG